MVGRGSDPRGQILFLVLIVMIVGFMVMGALLSLLNANILAGGRYMDYTMEYLVALSGLEALVADLAGGKDGLAPGYDPPKVEINNLRASFTISTPTGNGPPIAFLYLDPGTTSGLSPLRPNTAWTIKLWGVESHAPITVNLAFYWEDYTPPWHPLGYGFDEDDAKIEFQEDGTIVVYPRRGRRWGIKLESLWRISIYQETALMLRRWGWLSPAHVKTSAPRQGLYRVEFVTYGLHNLYSYPYDSLGDSAHTWVYSKLSGREYLVTVTAGNTSLSAFLRQLPGPKEGTPLLPQIMVQWFW